ncbi:sensor histidine kinase [Candidatus Poribacteria bacterium]|nr:sensor histidine kinase [Candidatus Poribacteria bacterium]
MTAWVLFGAGIAVGVVLAVAAARWMRRTATATGSDPAPPPMERIARGLAHEIRNPLNSMSITLQLLEEDLSGDEPPDCEGIRRQVTRVRGEIQRLEVILSDFLRYARQSHAELEPVQIGSVLHEVLDFVEPEADRLGVEIVREIDSTQPQMADPLLLKQAFLNLVLNAFQVMGDGGTLTVRGEQSVHGVDVVVRDTGGGIADEARARIFEPFFSTKKEGTGLGLAVVKQVSDLHGARIDVKSQPGQGTTFTLHFPSRPGTGGGSHD